MPEQGEGCPTSSMAVKQRSEGRGLCGCIPATCKKLVSGANPSVYSLAPHSDPLLPAPAFSEPPADHVRLAHGSGVFVNKPGDVTQRSANGEPALSTRRPYGSRDETLGEIHHGGAQAGFNKNLTNNSATTCEYDANKDCASYKMS